jgi:hypothetical protein
LRPGQADLNFQKENNPHKKSRRNEMKNAMRLILAGMLCTMLAAQEPEKEEGEAILEQCDTNKNGKITINR